MGDAGRTMNIALLIAGEAEGYGFGDALRKPMGDDPIGQWDLSTTKLDMDLAGIPFHSNSGRIIREHWLRGWMMGREKLLGRTWPKGIIDRSMDSRAARLSPGERWRRKEILELRRSEADLMMRGECPEEQREGEEETCKRC